jgi:hypothetical protein
MTRRRAARERRWCNRVRRAWWVRGHEWVYTQSMPREERMSHRRERRRRARERGPSMEWMLGLLEDA